MQSLLETLRSMLEQQKADFEILSHHRPLLSRGDAARVFDLVKAAPVFILEADGELTAFLASAARGRIDLKALRQDVGYASLRPVPEADLLVRTGCAPGRVPLVGHGLPVIFDEVLLRHDYVYGKTSDVLHTLKIRPLDLMRVCNVVKVWPDPQGRPAGSMATATFGRPDDQAR